MPSIWLQRGRRVGLRRLRTSDEEEFLRAVRRSRDLHRGYASPPKNATDFTALLRKAARVENEVHAVSLLAQPESLVGMYNVSQIFRGPFQSAMLGYYAFAPHNGAGLMHEALELLLRQLFRRYKLHRIEANIQPENLASIALVERVGFREEGYSPRYLKIGGRWRDHVRYAMTVEDWRKPRKRRR